MDTLNLFLQKDCQELIRGHFSADESLVYAKECGYQDRFGYAVVSNQRVITAVFNPVALFGGKRQRVSFYKPKGGLFSKLGAFQAERNTYLTPYSELSEQETKKRMVYEAPLNKIIGIEREEYRVKLKEKETVMVEITFMTEEEVVIDRPIFYTKEAGDAFHAMFNEIIAAGIAPAPTNKAALIDSLAELRKAGVLTDEEFEAKKKEILNQT